MLKDSILIVDLNEEKREEKSKEKINKGIHVKDNLN
jgi:hypothetical protein